ncbi:hypothetical protein ACWGH7_16670 [Streptomyces cyaneofuscatus]
MSHRPQSTADRTASRGTLVFALALWVIVLVAGVSMALGNPTAINAVLGCSVPAFVFSYWAWDFRREDQRAG